MRDPRLGLLSKCYTSQAQKQEIAKGDGRRKVSRLVLDSLTRLVSWLAVIALAVAIILLIKKLKG